MNVTAMPEIERPSQTCPDSWPFPRRNHQSRYQPKQAQIESPLTKGCIFSEKDDAYNEISAARLGTNNADYVVTLHQSGVFFFPQCIPIWVYVWLYFFLNHLEQKIEELNPKKKVCRKVVFTIVNSQFSVNRFRGEFL